MVKTIKKAKKETPIDVLARLVAQGFEKMTLEFQNGQEQLRQEMRQEMRQGNEQLRKEFRHGLEELKDEFREEIFSVKEEQKETNRHLVSIERKQEGTRVSMDETVHKSEFTKLEHRVEVLEHK